MGHLLESVSLGPEKAPVSLDVVIVFQAPCSLSRMTPNLGGSLCCAMPNFLSSKMEVTRILRSSGCGGRHASQAVISDFFNIRQKRFRSKLRTLITWESPSYAKFDRRELRGEKPMHCRKSKTCSVDSIRQSINVSSDIGHKSPLHAGGVRT